jgi:hypothetical protein
MPTRCLLFICEKCGWWALGTCTTDRALQKEDLANAEFEVVCVAEDCGWKARQLGREARDDPAAKVAAAGNGH